MGCVSLTGLPGVFSYNILIDILKLKREIDTLWCLPSLIARCRNLFCISGMSDSIGLRYNRKKPINESILYYYTYLGLGKKQANKTVTRLKKKKQPEFGVGRKKALLMEDRVLLHDAKAGLQRGSVPTLTALYLLLQSQNCFTETHFLPIKRTRKFIRRNFFKVMMSFCLDGSQQLTCRNKTIFMCMCWGVVVICGGQVGLETTHFKAILFLGNRAHCRGEALF